MFKNFFWVDAFSRMQAQNLIEKVDELRISDPLVPIVIEAFLEHTKQITKSRSEQLVLTRHYLSVVTACHPKESHVDSTVTIEHEDAALQGEPQREAGQHLEQNAPKTPHVKNEGNLCEVLHFDVCLLGETLREE